MQVVDGRRVWSMLATMVKVTVNYEGALRCSVEHGPSGNKLVTDAPVDNNGKGESFSPTDLCASALGACIATIVGMQTERLGIDLSGMQIEVSKEMTAELPRRIARLTTEIRVPVVVSEAHQLLIEKAARGCPVHLSLHSEIEKPIIFHWQ